MAYEIQGSIYTGAAQSLAALNKPFWVKLTAYDGTRYYTWRQQQLHPALQPMEDLDGGRFGSPALNPAYEPNLAVLPVPSYVRLQRGYLHPNLDWVYMILAGAGGSGVITPGTGTKSVPLQVTSLNPTNGLYPAVVLDCSPNAAPGGKFNSSGEQIWVLTTDENTLDITRYTGIFVGTGGSPVRDVYCINDNLVVADSFGLQKLVGRNELLFDPPCAWKISPGTASGQAIIDRLLSVLGSHSSPGGNTQTGLLFNVATVLFSSAFTVTAGPGPCDVSVDVSLPNMGPLLNFTPPCTWDITSGPGNQLNIRRLLSVGGINDVAEITFAPNCAWVVTQDPSNVCGVIVERLLTVQTDLPAPDGPQINNTALLQFEPHCTWDIVEGPCSATISRIFVVQTDDPSGGLFQNVANIRFIPDCAWTLDDDPCGVTVRRNLTVQDAKGAPPARDVAKIVFTPANCWQLTTGGASCQIYVQRVLNVSGNIFVTDVYQINFDQADFIVSNPQTGQATVKTKGLSTSVYYCDPQDNLVHRLDFVDGLLQGRA